MTPQSCLLCDGCDACDASPNLDVIRACLAPIIDLPSEPSQPSSSPLAAVDRAIAMHEAALVELRALRDAFDDSTRPRAPAAERAAVVPDELIPLREAAARLGKSYAAVRMQAAREGAKITLGRQAFVWRAWADAKECSLKCSDDEQPCAGP